MKSDELRSLDAKEVKFAPSLAEGEYIGKIMEAYGDWNFFKLIDGTYVKVWYSIGD
jgi:hypothetical protein